MRAPTACAFKCIRFSAALTILSAILGLLFLILQSGPESLNVPHSVPSSARRHVFARNRAFLHRSASAASKLLRKESNPASTIPLNTAAARFITTPDIPKPKEPLQLPYALWWYAPFFTGTGYGMEAQHYMLALSRGDLVKKEDLWISQHGDYWNKHYVHIMPPGDREELQGMMEHPTDQRHRTAIMVCHSLPLFWSGKGDAPWGAPGKPCPGNPRRRVYAVGRTMCEVDGIPPLLRDSCNKMDEVWVPSEWARTMFVESGVQPEKLVVVPEGVDTVQFDPSRYEPVPLPVGQLVVGRRQKRRLGRKPYVFLSTFKWEARKGYDLLLKAYLQEFSSTEPVELLIITRAFAASGDNFLKIVQDWIDDHLPLPPTPCANPDANTTEPCPHRERPLYPTIYIIRDHIPDDQLPRHYKAADAFVLPSRGEGWGRPQVEAMSMGLPVISTNWSGMTAYLDEAVGYPIRVENLTMADKANAPYFDGFKWAQASITHLREIMRHLVKNPGEGRRKGQAARQRMVREFSSDAVGLKVLKEVVRIGKKLQVQGARREAEPGGEEHTWGEEQ